jgi:hypothetical protein
MIAFDIRFWGFIGISAKTKDEGPENIEHWVV